MREADHQPIRNSHLFRRHTDPSERLLPELRVLGQGQCENIKERDRSCVRSCTRLAAWSRSDHARRWQRRLRGIRLAQRLAVCRVRWQASGRRELFRGLRRWSACGEELQHDTGYDSRAALQHPHGRASECGDAERHTAAQAWC